MATTSTSHRTMRKLKPVLIWELEKSRTSRRLLATKEQPKMQSNNAISNGKLWAVVPGKTLKPSNNNNNKLLSKRRRLLLTLNLEVVINHPIRSQSMSATRATSQSSAMTSRLNSRKTRKLNNKYNNNSNQLLNNNNNLL